MCVNCQNCEAVGKLFADLWKRLAFFHQVVNGFSIGTSGSFPYFHDARKSSNDQPVHRQRLLSIRVRNELTAEWQERGVQQGKEYAILTDEITKAWSGMTTRQYKKLKGLKKENLRDNMSTMEIVLNMLAEATTTELSKAHQPEGFSESQKIAHRGGSYAGQVRQDIEKDTGRPVITSQNAAQLNAVVVDMIESVAETEKPDNDENK